jgi:hypothetical protein
VVLGVVAGCPMPGLGVTVPVFWAVATPTASVNTKAASRIFRIEACSFARIAVQPWLVRSARRISQYKRALLDGMRLPPSLLAKDPLSREFCKLAPAITLLGP